MTLLERRKLIAIEAAVIIGALLLVVVGQELAAATWLAGYIVGYRKCLRARSEGDKG